ncbi:hypothetical protein HanHA300_Chr16g0600701 [Helianthus annuus]|nr:hypothetical protein HanHA300_Chr16g0600701 [Helianthus annuus]KAJ0459634.1 hypothetical protein HanHA89_Chr16g0651221 [Helianthus annuus]
MEINPPPPHPTFFFPSLHPLRFVHHHHLPKPQPPYITITNHHIPKPPSSSPSQPLVHHPSPASDLL